MKNLYLLLLLAFLSVPTHSQSLWNGLIDPSRATDWSTAGVIGGIPSDSWTQCGPPIAAYNGNTDTINLALNHTAVGYTGCAANTYVLLGPGTFNLTSGGTVSNGVKATETSNNSALRGSGANKTFLIFGAGATDSCSGAYATTICMNGSQGRFWVSDAKFADWTGGLARGSTILTLSSVSGLFANQSAIGVDQCSDGNTGYPCSTNLEPDNGEYFNCERLYDAGTGNGCSSNGITGNHRSGRPLSEIFLITNVNSGAKQVTIRGGVRFPHYAAGNSPAVWSIPNPISNFGIEDLSIDNTAVNAYCIVGYYAVNAWIKGVRCIKSGQGAFLWVSSAHDSDVDNYAYSTTHSYTSADSEGDSGMATSDILHENNIYQWLRTCDLTDGSDTGSVFAYNFCVNNTSNQSG